MVWRFWNVLWFENLKLVADQFKQLFFCDIIMRTTNHCQNKQLTRLDNGIDQLSIFLPLDPHSSWIFPVARMCFANFVERA